ncbi:MAG: fibronectin type III domain-containing protein [Kiritimatiellae bacterium]|nr:fibronectin type III domain-containing protein [Kiritimatiellia bacterium]
MNKYIHSLILLEIIMVPILIDTNIFADDYKSEHRIKPSDVISADVINELFDKIQRTANTPSMENIIGVWKGTAYGLSGYPKTADWQDGTNSLYVCLTNVTMTFSPDYFVTYDSSNEVWITNSAAPSITCTPTPFEIDSSAGFFEIYNVQAGTLFKGGSGYRAWTIDKLSDTRIRLTAIGGGVYTDYSYLIVLDKQNLPPKKPTDLNLTFTGRDVVLTWSDNSDNEQAFVVYRKDQLTSSYSNIIITTSNITCCTNTVLDAGIYWYRVSTTNSYGESAGSNVRKIIVP